jgi:hypothetical protein
MTTPSIDALRSTLELVDNMSQDAFGRIKSLCKVALIAMEQQSRPVEMEDLAQILKQIEQASEEAENCINVEAESLGCNYKDQAWYRRIDARHAWRQLQSQEAS